MGSPCEFRLYAPTASQAESATAAARAEVERLECKYSRFLEESLASRINRSAGDSEGLAVDDETAALLDYADVAHRESNGLFDPTSGILRRAWNFRSGQLPDQSAIDALLPLIGWQQLRWQRPRLALPHAGMELDWGGFVKEYAADRVAELCRRQGLAHGLVDLGGDLAVVGPHPDGSAWRIGIRNPRRPDRPIATLSLVGGGIATSGDYERFMIVDGRRYAHILDPRTGWPIEGLASVSVAGAHCLVAGTATTVALLRGEEGPGWLAGLGLPHMIVDAAGQISGTLVSGGSRRAVDHHELGGPATPASA